MLKRGNNSRVIVIPTSAISEIIYISLRCDFISDIFNLRDQLFGNISNLEASNVLVWLSFYKSIAVTC